MPLISFLVSILCVMSVFLLVTSCNISCLFTIPLTFYASIINPSSLHNCLFIFTIALSSWLFRYFQGENESLDFNTDSVTDEMSHQSPLAGSSFLYPIQDGCLFCSSQRTGWVALVLPTLVMYWCLFGVFNCLLVFTHATWIHLPRFILSYSMKHLPSIP